VRWRLLQGLDDIGITMQNDDVIATFESSRPAYAPTTIS
jgi:3-isopropylmalate/(R)-2-methylmalate dehydratase small subunit